MAEEERNEERIGSPDGSVPDEKQGAGTPESLEGSVVSKEEENAQELLSHLKEERASAMTEAVAEIDTSDLQLRKSSFVPTALMTTAALIMFVGGAMCTLLMLARALDLHGHILLSFVVGASAGVLGCAGMLLSRTLGDKSWTGLIGGICFGALGALIVYMQTRHYAWWQ